MVTLLAEQIMNKRLCHAGRVYQYPLTPPKKNFIANLHESQDPSFLKKTAEFPRIRGESSCLFNNKITGELHGYINEFSHLVTNNVIRANDEDRDSQSLIQTLV